MIKDFTPIFSAADVRFCHDANLNGGAAFTIGGYPKFNSPTEFVRDMGKIGCNLVADGTNHSFDRNQDAINASIDTWKKVPNMLAVVGQNHNQAEHDTVSYFTVKGVKFAFLAYTTYLNLDAPAQNDYGVNVYSNDFAASQIKTAKDNGAKVIITSIRWGTEYSGDVSASQKSTAQFLADQGVDLVIGHGSHVLEPVAQLSGAGGKKTLVWYSIGNFLNTQEPPETLFNGLPVVDFDKNTLQVTGMSFLPIYQHYEWTAAQAAADDIAARNNIHMYLLENATQAMIDAQQLKTTIAAQKQRITTTLNADGLTVPLITSKQYYDE
jgi:poly-gamma-glutamate capsule biosynthesis protein CapA/YwtB (metallophosphatase superfamily)